MTIHEPATLVTDYLLGVLGIVCGIKMREAANHPRRWWSGALFLMGSAAIIGGTHHGLGPSMGELTSAVLWRMTLLLLSLTSAAMSLTLVHELAGEATRFGWCCAVWFKFAIFAAVGLARPTFLVAIADYGTAMLSLAVAALCTARAWRGLMLAAVAVSMLAAAVQRMRWGISAHFNHNDLYHVIQFTAVFLFYRAGLKLGNRTLPQGEGNEAKATALLPP